jgi:S1-C subfamily serine protease
MTKSGLLVASLGIGHATFMYLALSAISGSSLAAALIPPIYMDCVVAIGREAPVLNNGLPVVENGTAKMQWEPVATGFLYGEPTGKKDKAGSTLYSVFLVTNRHVFAGSSELSLRFNPANGQPAKAYTLSLFDANKKPIWYTPSDTQIDVAVILVNTDYLLKDGITPTFFAADLFTADLVRAKEMGVSEGDGVFVLGFPAQLSGGDRNYVVVRQGVIARISDTLVGSRKTFVIDTFIFPGNSGGPVVLKPEMQSITGTKNQNQAVLIGLVSSFQTYQETAVSLQTGRPRIIFEENSGLANVVPVDQIKDAVTQALKVLNIK